MNLKKIILPIITLLLLIPFTVKAETCDCDLNKITIDSVTIKEKSDSVTEIEEPVIEGKKIRTNLKMLNVGDSIEYKLLIKNDSNEDYELDKSSLSSKSNYIEYTLNTDDGKLIIKAGKTKEVYLRIQYKNEVPDEKFNEGIFNDNESLVLNVLNDSNITNNPKTGTTQLIIFIIVTLCFIGFAYTSINKKKHGKLMLLITGLLIAVPASVYALCKVEITIDSNISIEKQPEYEVGYLNNFKSVLLTDEELEKVQVTPNTNCNILYIGETKYNDCLGVIIKAERKYKEGEIVNIESPSYRGYTFTTSCRYNEEDYNWHCPADTEIKYMSFNFDEVLSYNDLNNNEINYVETIETQTYTMPANNVLLAQCWGNACK